MIKKNYIFVLLILINVYSKIYCLTFKKKLKIMANTENAVKEYKDERFEFSLFVNDKLVCKRNFRINNYIENSMNSLNFKETVDSIVKTIDDDLKSKSRVYTWYYSDFFEDFKDAPLKPWECTFRFEITDNKNLVISRIWDGYAYPKPIRDRVDIANKTVRITDKFGNVYVYDKDEYFKENEGKLSLEMYVLKSMINDKQDLLSFITKKICESCSPREDLYNSISDYTVSEVYRNKPIVDTDENGNVKLTKNGKPILKSGKSKKYYYNNQLTYNQYVSDWALAVSAKTKQYFDELAEFDKAVRKFS